MREWLNQSGEERKRTMLANGYCPVCEIRIISKYHAPCPFLSTDEYRCFLDKMVEDRINN